MKLANIVSTDKLSVSEDFNVVKSLDEIIQGLPTLVIGYYNCKKIFPSFNITNREIEKNIFWTFRRTEKRDKYQEDLDWFTYKVYYDLAKTVKYVFVDPLQQKPKTIRKILRKLYSLENLVTYINGEMVYIYGDSIIFGVDLKLLRYMSIDTDKIKNKLRLKSSVFLSNDKIIIEYKKSIGILENNIRYLPFIYSISNGKNNSPSLIHLPRTG